MPDVKKQIVATRILRHAVIDVILPRLSTILIKPAATLLFRPLDGLDAACNRHGFQNQRRRKV
jgi:hypothetical protein